MVPSNRREIATPYSFHYLPAVPTTFPLYPLQKSLSYPVLPNVLTLSLPYNTYYTPWYPLLLPFISFTVLPYPLLQYHYFSNFFSLLFFYSTIFPPTGSHSLNYPLLSTVPTPPHSILYLHCVSMLYP